MLHLKEGIQSESYYYQLEFTDKKNAKIHDKIY